MRDEYAYAGINPNKLLCIMEPTHGESSNASRKTTIVLLSTNIK